MSILSAAPVRIQLQTTKSIYEIDQALRTLGYFAGFPFSMTAEERREEAEEAASHSCICCGYTELSLQPYYRDDRCESVCVCNECGYVAILESRRAS